MGFTQKRKAKSKDEKKLQKSNQSKVRRAHKLLELKKEQMARAEGEYFYDNRNYIYSRLDYEPPKRVSAPPANVSNRRLPSPVMC